MELPIQQIIAVPEAGGHGYEQIISILEQHQGGIGAFPDTAAVFTFLVVLITVAQVQGVAVGLFLNFHIVVPSTIRIMFY